MLNVLKLSTVLQAPFVYDESCQRSKIVLFATKLHVVIYLGKNFPL